MNTIVKFGALPVDHGDIAVECVSTDEAGDLVYVRGDLDTEGRWRVERANCFDESKMPAVGIIVSKSSDTVGIMRRVGKIDIFTGLDITKHYFVGQDGELQEGAPTAPSGSVAVAQRIGIPLDPDVLWLTGEIGMLFKLVGF